MSRSGIFVELFSSQKKVIPIQGNPLKTNRAFEGFKIWKPNHPAVYITVRDEGLTVLLEVEVTRDADNSIRDNEKLEVRFNGGRNYLVKPGEAFLVPEQASKYILRPMLQTLKGEVWEGFCSFSDRV